MHDKNPHADGQSIRSGAANRLDLEALTAVASSIRILSMDAVEASGTGHRAPRDAPRLCGYDIPMAEVKQLRRIGSITPGHPEYGHTVHGTLFGPEEIRAAKRAAPTGHGFTVARLARRVEETL